MLEAPTPAAACRGFSMGGFQRGPLTSPILDDLSEQFYPPRRLSAIGKAERGGSCPMYSIGICKYRERRPMPVGQRNAELPVERVDEALKLTAC